MSKSGSHSHGDHAHDHADERPHHAPEAREHGRGGPHGHSHAGIDPSIAASDRGIWAVKWSFVILFTAAAFQLAIVLLSNSIGLLADTIHNFGDAGTAIPLGIAFLFAKKKPTERFSYGYGRFEDFAGIMVVLIILASAVVAGYESVRRLVHPEPVTHLGAVIAASVIGFAGNEWVAIFRIKVGKAIGSAALIADGYHARTDGWTSLAVLVGALGVHFGYPKADPIIGLLITAAILVIVWQSAKEVLVRALDGVDPHVLEELRHAARHVEGVQEVTEVRARWLGHQLLAELNLAVAPEKTVAEAHGIATAVHQQLLQHLNFLARATVHIDAVGASGEHHHFAADDRHDHPAGHEHH
ncbi:MAG: cation diffusion facilitator family transporter [Acidobacteriota bacterium]|nr:cation diffusion facilitator family transporter [Acidobacteriota bacterium]